MEIKMKALNGFVRANKAVIGETYACEEGKVYLRCRFPDQPSYLPSFINVKTGQYKVLDGDRALRIFNCELVEI